MTRGCTELWEARPDRAHWLELSKLEPGSLVEFVEDWDIFPWGVIPTGMIATVKENGLNEIWGTLLVEPMSPPAWLLRENEEGVVYLTMNPLDPSEADEFRPAPVKIISGPPRHTI